MPRFSWSSLLLAFHLPVFCFTAVPLTANFMVFLFTLPDFRFDARVNVQTVCSPFDFIFGLLNTLFYFVFFVANFFLRVHVFFSSLLSPALYSFCVFAAVDNLDFDSEIRWSTPFSTFFITPNTRVPVTLPDCDSTWT